MMVLLASGIGFKTHRLVELEAMALEIGYDGLELHMPPHHLPPEESRRDTTYESTSTIQVVHSPGDIYDMPRFTSALDTGCTTAQLVSAKKVVVHPASLAYGGRDNVLQAIEYIKNKEDETGIHIAYEVLVNPYGLQPERQAWFAEQQAYMSVEAWVQDVQEYELHACLDTTHIGSWEKDPAAYLDALGEHLVHVHFSDYSHEQKNEHLAPGEGNVDLTKFLQALVQRHPDITLTVEVHPRTTLVEVEAVAKASFQYITEVLV